MRKGPGTNGQGVAGSSRPRPTLRDVALRAGVSAKTVSNVINRTAPVSEETRLRVDRALVELDYVPNLSARGLRNGRSDLIAVALPDLASAYSAEIAHHFITLAGEDGLGVQLEETYGKADREIQLLSRAKAHLVDGLILNPVRLETSAVQRGIVLPPVVLIGEVHQPIADHVWIDNVGASRDIVALLINEGHRRIAAVGATKAESARQRLQGFREAHAAAGLSVRPELEIPCVNWDGGGGYRAVAGFLAEHEPPDAIFCMTDAMAIGAISALAAAGLRVPDDVSIAGYDNVWEARFAHPPLTTVDFDKRRLARLALELLSARIDDTARPIQSVTVPYSIVRRDSIRSRRS
ncbi:LacI family DNA-binding transcriptional regulator [Microlunatus parietis]|uniref:DNA-binding LacI/PurR family transcriptional regulator n=1 Tax=Microlunatus parietis TaxID=682979 RepID=A0A7Y9LAX2_9ACTN|nr:LacI family DNA-binding transcriptional regulator [Microlunatus parietis]NYE71132.1 DNA-binding LacI/PurR family transcriptional regulator [Microlunatus parietis]